RYERLAGEIDQALAFMRACGADPDQLRSVELYSSHEALMLDYEQALTRIDSRTGRPYGTSGHLPGRGAGADRRAEPGQPAGAAHADHEDRRRADPCGAARPGPRGHRQR